MVKQDRFLQINNNDIKCLKAKHLFCKTLAMTT